MYVDLSEKKNNYTLKNPRLSPVSINTKEEFELHPDFKLCQKCVILEEKIFQNS